MTLKNGFGRVRYLFYQPMDKKIKTWPLCFPSKEEGMDRLANRFVAV